LIAATIGTPVLWGVFFVLILIMLVIDLGVFHRHEHEIKSREAAIWTVVWVVLSLGFNLWIYLEDGREPALEFLTGYLIEKALSIDNIFVFIVIFAYFKVPPRYHHRVLFWGILGALVMRGLFIALGTVLISRFEWILYLFGAFLVYTGIKIVWNRGTEVHPEDNPVVGFFERFVPLTRRYHGKHFLVREGGRLLATPLLLVLVVVEATDILFAVDSIPAIFGVTRDPFIVFTSNIFAILGLRALYFLLADLMDRFDYLPYGLGLVLAFIGAKMLVHPWIEVPIEASLGAVVVLLGGSVVVSILFDRRRRRDGPPPGPGEGGGDPPDLPGSKA